ncbi:MAG: phosphate/phosphite/phosphonate ABC transporter substrate-binding protein [Opitutae bacterium]|nr:phosphate/phosphite/phosphonate ABC transporter substrate-binding protein [Opitutae bacterium]
MKLRSVLLLLGVAICADHADASLRLGTYQYGSVDRIGAIRPVAEYLERELGETVTAVVLPGVWELVAAVEAGEVDCAVINTAGYLALAAAKDARAEAIVALDTKARAAERYNTVIIAPSAQGGSWDDVAAWARGLRLALVVPGSTTGDLVPRLALAQRGVADAEQAFSRVGFAGSHAKALDAVVTGDADLAALAESEFDAQLKREPALAARLRVLWRSPAIPLGPIVVRRALPAETRAALRQALMRLPEKSPAAFAALKSGWSEFKTADAIRLPDPNEWAPILALAGPESMAAYLRRPR